MTMFYSSPILWCNTQRQSNIMSLVMLAGEAAQLDPQSILEDDQMTALSKELAEDVVHTVVGTCGASDMQSQVVFDQHFINSRTFVTLGGVRPSSALCRALGLAAPQDLSRITETVIRRQYKARPFCLKDFQPV